DEARESLAALGLDAGVVAMAARERQYGDIRDLARDRVRAPDLVDTAVVRDAVQPRPQRDRPAVGPQRHVGADEHVLEDVLRLATRGAEHLPGIGQQAYAVAVVYDPEGVV